MEPFTSFRFRFAWNNGNILLVMIRGGGIDSLGLSSSRRGSQSLDGRLAADTVPDLHPCMWHAFREKRGTLSTAATAIYRPPPRNCEIPAVPTRDIRRREVAWGSCDLLMLRLRRATRVRSGLRFSHCSIPNDVPCPRSEVRGLRRCWGLRTRVDSCRRRRRR